MFKASTIISELTRYEPKIVDLCKKSLDNSFKDLDFQRIKKNFFEECPNIPIDIAVMEKTNLGFVLALEAGWDDIGSWKSVWENSNKDINGNEMLTVSINTETEEISFSYPENSSMARDCGEATAECLSDSYTNRGWTSVGLWVITGFFPLGYLSV